ncbi:DENN domain-containing protein [Carpediemonas membranifera]|uniref:DENN domain-containing protein n=1 Tax=Carpediemonas membranifera TaxID=201153 RepID=A0A8J6AXP9_9EUKA|nr:DENN domain-containing protein [Carpediemonas membranifera]|eukprot:KAG9397411.1 DENN domain-containing protein [Carpediemonas membranifera]
MLCSHFSVPATSRSSQRYCAYSEMGIVDIFCVANQVKRNGMKEVELEYSFFRDGLHIPGIKQFFFTDMTSPDKFTSLHSIYAMTLTTDDGTRYFALCKRFDTYEVLVGARVIRKLLHSVILDQAATFIATHRALSYDRLHASILRLATEQLDPNLPNSVGPFIIQPRHLRSPPIHTDITPIVTRIYGPALVKLLGALLLEHRVLIVARELHTLTACAIAMPSMLAPHEWSGVFIPLLPQHMAEYLMAPTSYIIGIQEYFLSTLPAEATDGTVLVNVDSGRVTPMSGVKIPSLPAAVATPLSKLTPGPDSSSKLRELQCMLVRNTEQFVQDIVTDGKAKRTFNMSGYLKSRSGTASKFLTAFLQTQAGAEWRRAVETSDEACVRYQCEGPSITGFKGVFNAFKQKLARPSDFEMAMRNIRVYREVPPGFAIEQFPVLHDRYKPKSMAAPAVADIAGGTPEAPWSARSRAHSVTDAPATPQRQRQSMSKDVTEELSDLFGLVGVREEAEEGAGGELAAAFDDFFAGSG